MNKDTLRQHQFGLRILLLNVAAIAVMCASVTWNGGVVTGIMLLISLASLKVCLTAATAREALLYLSLFLLTGLLTLMLSLPTIH